MIDAKEGKNDMLLLQMTSFASTAHPHRRQEAQWLLCRQLSLPPLEQAAHVPPLRGAQALPQLEQVSNLPLFPFESGSVSSPFFSQR
jgi:hypothetical protein